MGNLLRRLLRWLSGRPDKVMYIGGSDTLPPPLPRQEEAEWISRLEQGELLARQTLIERNLRLVVYIARRFENTGINIEDLISIGTIGLIKAINTFRADKNIKLATYASRCIENEILMYHAIQCQAFIGVPSAVADGQHHTASRQLDELSVVQSLDRRHRPFPVDKLYRAGVIVPCAALLQYLTLDAFDDRPEPVRADVRFVLYQDLLGRAVLRQRFQHQPAQWVFPTAGQLAIRKRPRAAVPKQYVALRIKRAAVKKRLDGALPLCQGTSTFQHHRRIPLPCQH